MIIRLPICIAVLLFMLAGCGKVNSSGQVLRLGHGLDESHTVHKSMAYMAGVLDSLSNGNLTIKIYPSQQLGTERECLELLQIGSLDITKVSAAVLENFSPDLSVLSIPYLFDSKEHQFSVLDGEIGRELLASTKPYRLEGLCFYDAGSRSFYTKNTPISQPADLLGLKIRVQESAMAMNMVKALGGSPTPVSWGELYTALQQGVVDGAENNPPSFYLSRHYEVCKYYSVNQHTMVPDVVLVSSATMKRLSAQEQNWLQKAAQLSVIFQRKLWAEDVDRSMAALAEAGVEIIYPDKGKFRLEVDELLSQQRGNPVIRKYVDRITR